MKKILFLLSTVAIMASCSQQTAKVAGINYQYMDTTVLPGNDFAQYAIGHWGDYNPQPLEYPMWGATTKVYDDNTKTLAALIQDIASKENEPGTIAQKIGDTYNLMMDSVRLNSEGAAPLKKYLEAIEAIATREDFLAYCAKEHTNLFSMFIGPDEKDSENNIVCVSQSGLLLGDREYYLSDDPNKKAIADAMLEYTKNLLILAGYPEDKATEMANSVRSIENEIAVPYYSKEMMRIPEANYHKVSVDSLTKLCGGFDWDGYLKAYGYDKTTEVDLGQPEPVAKACNLLMNVPLENLKAFAVVNTIMNNASLLSDAFLDENFKFNQKITGVQQKTPRWKNAVSLVDNLMADAVGQMYVERYFPAGAKEEMLELIHNLQFALGERIKAQTWMSDSTKTVALDKLVAYGIKVGYPDKWEDLSGLVIDPTLSLVDNIIAARKFYWDLDYEKHYNKPVDKDEWFMSPQTVNAYYNPCNNEICFPAGFLQAPMFDLNHDAAANYGAIGVVIGHEMTHGFDDQGRMYDKTGNLCEWWKEEDAQAFKIPCGKMTEYFDSLWVIPGELHANGTMCLGENLADHGGLNIAYDAFQKWQKDHGRLADDNGFTPEQRFFLSYANVWAGITPPTELLRYLTIMDVHSIDRLRINGALSQCNAWYDAFNIKPGDSLYIAPENRIDVW